MSISCQEYNILWRDYSISDDNRVVLKFKDHGSVKNINLIKNKSVRLFIYNTSKFVGWGLPANCYIYIDPFFENNHISEFFIYDMQVIEKTTILL